MGKKAEKLIVGQVLDAETGEMVEIASEKQSLASYVHQQAIIGIFVSAMAIRKMIDEKLYLYLGCESRDEYIDRMLPYGRSQTYKLIRVASKFSQALELKGNDVRLLASGEEEDSESANKIQQLGISKLYEIANLEDEDVNDFVKKGTLKVADGELTVDEIRDMTIKEFQKSMADTTKKYKSKISQLAEDNRLLKAENETYKEEDKRIASIRENAETLERQFGAVASTRKQKKEYLHKATEQLNELIETIFRIGINEEDSANDQQDLVNFIKKYNEAGERILENYQAVTVNFQ